MLCNLDHNSVWNINDQDFTSALRYIICNDRAQY